MASNAQINSAQANYKNALENSLGGRLTQPQVEQARRQSREQRSKQSGNTISKGGAAGVAAVFSQMLGGAPLGSREAELRMKMMFSRTGLTDAEYEELGIKRINQYYDNVPDMSAVGGNWEQRQKAIGVEAMTPGELRTQLMGSQPINTSGLQGLSMIEKGRLSSQGLLGGYMSNNQLGSQAGLPPGGLMGTSALGQATGGYFG